MDELLPNCHHCGEGHTYHAEYVYDLIHRVAELEQENARLAAALAEISGFTYCYCETGLCPRHAARAALHPTKEPTNG